MAPFNLTSFPTIRFRSGRGDGLQLATQLVARPFEEALLIPCGLRFESSTDWHRRTLDDPPIG